MKHTVDKPFLPRLRHHGSLLARREFLHRAAIGTGLAAASGAFFHAFLHVPGAFAQQLVETAAQTEGPFYPDKLPLDTDNDLLIINDSITPAIGQVTWLTGRVLDRRGDPVRGALIEIWQVDGNGVYLHNGSSNGQKRDRNFQGFGRFITGSNGEYLFRTVKPVPYDTRTAHVHFQVEVPKRHKLVTQMYIEGEPLNAKDRLLNAVKDPKARASITVPFLPLPNTRTGELGAKFDIVLGYTPAG
jgi:protocatechuate 3,4-dioxygenase, beta subunit